MQKEVLNVQQFLEQVSTDQHYKSRFRALLRRKKNVEKVRAPSPERAPRKHTRAQPHVRALNFSSRATP